MLGYQGVVSVFIIQRQSAANGSSVQTFTPNAPAR